MVRSAYSAIVRSRCPSATSWTAERRLHQRDGDHTPARRRPVDACQRGACEPRDRRDHERRDALAPLARDQRRERAGRQRDREAGPVDARDGAQPASGESSCV